MYILFNIQFNYNYITLFLIKGFEVFRNIYFAIFYYPFAFFILGQKVILKKLIYKYLSVGPVRDYAIIRIENIFENPPNHDLRFSNYRIE